MSLALARAAASDLDLPLFEYISNLYHNDFAFKPNFDGAQLQMPVPCFNVINGGKHAGNDLAFQEFMLVPLDAGSYHEALQMGSEVYHRLRELLKKKYGKQATNVGDEGGFAPPVSNEREALELV